MRRKMGGLVGVLLFCWAFTGRAQVTASAAQQQPADRIFHNGKVLTGEDQFSIAQAVAVAGNRITAVGSNADGLQRAGPNTRVMDPKGGTVIPGLIDIHPHSNGEAWYAG